jgi:hypothetical protein
VWGLLVGVWDYLVVCGGLLLDRISAVASFQPWYWDKAVLEKIDIWVKVSAVVLAGIWTALGVVWTSLKYIAQHALVHKLELQITAKVSQHNGVFLLLGASAVQNIGLSNVEIQRRGSALIVYADTLETITKPYDVDDAILVGDVIQGDKEKISPGERMESPFAVPLGTLSPDVVAVTVRLRVVGHRVGHHRHVLEWNRLERLDLASLRQDL